jgi:hypothetical protein
MRSKLLIASVLAGAVVLVAAGCGGSSKKPSASATTAPATTAAASTSTAQPTAFASTKNCRQLAALGTKMSQAMQAASGKGGTDLTAEAKGFQSMADAAPSEIRGDFKTFATAFNAYAQALDKAGYKPGTVPNAGQLVQMMKAVKAFSAPQLQTAEQHMTAWAQKNCSG